MPQTTPQNPQQGHRLFAVPRRRPLPLPKRVPMAVYEVSEEDSPRPSPIVQEVFWFVAFMMATVALGAVVQWVFERLG